MELHHSLHHFNRFFLLFGKVHMGLKPFKCYKMLFVIYSFVMMVLPLIMFILRIRYVITGSLDYVAIMTQHISVLMVNAMAFSTSVGFFFKSFKSPFMAYAKSSTSFQVNVTLKQPVTFALIFCGVIVPGLSLGASLITIVMLYPNFIKPCLATGSYSFCLIFADLVISTILGLPTLLTVVYHLASCVIIAKAFEKYFSDEIMPISSNVEDCTVDHLER